MKSQCAKAVGGGGGGGGGFPQKVPDQSRSYDPRSSHEACTVEDVGEEGIH